MTIRDDDLHVRVIHNTMLAPGDAATTVALGDGPPVDVLDRLGLDPIGVGAGLVLLTAVHLHVAGLVATTVVWQTVHRVGGRALPALAGTMAAPPIVALGFAAVPAMQVVGAIVCTAALLWRPAPRCGAACRWRRGGRSGG